ncbi:MAG: hypothetical protein LAO31_00080 [Acidobacteriia bacterium]|nr:hypothetical protein [Terriglobia bacterium]
MSGSFVYIVIFLGLWSLDLLVNFVNSGRIAIVPSIHLDGRIPFIPWFIYFYCLYFPLIVFPFFVLFEVPRLMERYLLASAMVMLSSYIIFLAVPTKLIRIPIQPRAFSERLTLLLHRLVAPYNLLPSMHVSMLIVALSVLFVHRNAYGWVLSLPMGLSMMSVVFTKQHYILDLVAAIPLGLLAFFLSAPVQAWIH